MSLDDKKLVQKTKQGISQEEDGHNEIPLLFFEEEPRMTNNRSLAKRQTVTQRLHCFHAI